MVYRRNNGRSDDDGMPCTSTSAPPKKKARVETDTVDDSEYTENLKKLDAEFKKEKPSRPLIRELMKLSVNGRHKWIQDKEPLVEEIITTFPALQDQKTVSCKLLSHIDPGKRKYVYSFLANSSKYTNSRTCSLIMTSPCMHAWMHPTLYHVLHNNYCSFKLYICHSHKSGFSLLHYLISTLWQFK